MPTTVHVDIVDTIAIVTLDRPPVYALDAVTLRALADIFEHSSTTDTWPSHPHGCR
jgi:enoyl-CoA hydratase/carnithine racemase